MSKSSRRRKRLEAARLLAKLNAASVPPPPGGTQQRQAPADDGGENDPENKVGFLGITIKQWFASILVWCVLTLVANHFSNSPNVLYIAAVAFCLWFGWRIGHKKPLWKWLAIVIPSCALLVYATHIYVEYEKKPKPVPKPQPKLIFSLGLSSSLAKPPEEWIALTNEFLVVTKFETAEVVKCLPFLVAARTGGQSNAYLSLRIFNDSSVIAEHAQIVLSLLDIWKCEPTYGWERAAKMDGDSFDVFELEKGVLSTNSIDHWGYRMPFGLLAGTGDELPVLKVRQNSGEVTNSSTGQRIAGDIVIMARAKDSPTTMVKFCMLFPSAAVAHKPFFILGTNIDGVFFELTPIKGGFKIGNPITGSSIEAAVLK